MAGVGPQACGRGSNSDRIRSTTTAALRTKLVELMNDFQALNTRLKNEYRHALPMMLQWPLPPTPARPLLARYFCNISHHAGSKLVIAPAGRGQQR